jgi:hypothetical protein
VTAGRHEGQSRNTLMAPAVGSLPADVEQKRRNRPGGSCAAQATVTERSPGRVGAHRVASFRRQAGEWSIRP